MCAERRSVQMRAFAKINLGLKILSRRPDDFHEIRTIYQTVSLCDRLKISCEAGKGETRVECTDPCVPAGSRNLIHRTCELWREERRFQGPIRVFLEKMIPMGSGLGGASSDAAATLLGLERLTGDKLELKARLRLAVQLGSDVPFFLWGGRALGCGRGEEVYPLVDLPRRYCLIVFPLFSVSTVAAYREADLRLTRHSRGSSINYFGEWSPFPHRLWGPAENDFEQVVFARWPGLASLKAQLIRAGAETASLTGSGSALFAIFASAQILNRATRAVPDEWQVFRSRTLPRAEYERLRFVTPL